MSNTEVLLRYSTFYIWFSILRFFELMICRSTKLLIVLPATGSGQTHIFHLSGAFKFKPDAGNTVQLVFLSNIDNKLIVQVNPKMVIGHNTF